MYVLGADPLLQILYETDRPQEATDIVMLHDIPAVWRYRAMITVNHLRQNLDTTKQKLPVLRLFLKEVHKNYQQTLPFILTVTQSAQKEFNRKHLEKNILKNITFNLHISFKAVYSL